MPRHADPQLERRILDAAHKLWKRGGERALTMRAVAKAARTTTPTVYQRFRDRQDIQRALLRRIRQELVELLQPCHSAQEACERYVEFALAHPHEYELFFAHQYQLLHSPRSANKRAPAEPRPGMELLQAKLAQWLGGTPADYTRLSLALYAVAHGAAMLLITRTVDEALNLELRRSCSAAVALLVQNASAIRGPEIK